jgi:hypothetical protein
MLAKVFPAPRRQRRIVADGRGKLLNSVEMAVAVAKHMSSTSLVVPRRENLQEPSSPQRNQGEGKKIEGYIAGSQREREP